MQKSTKAVGPCNNWQSSVGLIPNLSLMNISLGDHQGEWPCTRSLAHSPSAGLSGGRSPSLRPSADWWTSFCSLSRGCGLCSVHSTYTAGYCVNFIYILTTTKGNLIWCYLIFETHLSRVAMAMQTIISAATPTMKARMMIQPVKMRKKV